MARHQIVERLFDSINQLQGMRANLFSKLAYLLDILVLKVLFRKTTIGFDQTPRKIRRSIAHKMFYLIEHSTNLFWSEMRVVEERDKRMNGLLKIDIILPKGIVCINQEMVVHLFFFLSTVYT